MPASLLLLELETLGMPPQGDCNIPGFENHIVLNSIRWSLSATTAEEAKDIKEQITLKPRGVTVTKTFDRSSTALCNLMMQERSKGPHFKTATLRFIDPNTGSAQGSGAKYDSVMEIKLVNGNIDKLSVSVSDGSKSVAVTETVELSFETSISVSYSAYNAQKRFRESAKFFRCAMPSVK